MTRVGGIPNVMTSPAPDVDALQFTAAGPQLCVRPHCPNAYAVDGVLAGPPIRSQEVA
jgi:hypothetical protein